MSEPEEKTLPLESKSEASKTKRGKPVIQVRHVSKIYPVEDDEPVIALNDISLDIYAGEICCIFGTSGSGKSTLLNQLAGLEKPERGAIRIGSTIVNSLNEEQLALFRQKQIGFVFQSYNLLPQMTALENVEMPLIFQGMDPKKRKRAVIEMLVRVGLQKRMAHYPRQMSGGQQQRVGIARALVAHPAILFADEPTGNLDSKSSRQIMELFQKFSRDFHQTIVIVSHDPETADYADHIVRLSDGRIVEETFKDPNHRTSKPEQVGEPDQIDRTGQPNQPQGQIAQTDAIESI